MSRWFSPGPATSWNPRPRHGDRSGGNYALAAARALIDSDKDAETIVRRALDIAADICVFTNRSVTIETCRAAEPWCGINGAGLWIP